MSFNVRLYGHVGTNQIPCVNQVQNQSDSVQRLVYPYQFAQLLVTNGSTPVSSVADPQQNTNAVRIEVQDGQTIRFEINPPNRAVAASTNSPRLSGEDVFFWGNGYTISLIEGTP
jgi:hypothetical protein